MRNGWPNKPAVFCYEVVNSIYSMMTFFAMVPSLAVATK